MPTAYQTKQYTVSNTAVTLEDFLFTDQELDRMESVVLYTKGDVLITFDGETSPIISPEFGIYLPSGTIYTLTGHKNLDNLGLIRAGATDSLVTVTLEYGE